MPGAFRVTCTACDFVVESIASSTYVTLADGQEVVCPHPLERRYAEDATGLEWGALVRDGRLTYRYAFLCLGCGELVHRGPRDLRDGARPPGHLLAITHQPSLREASSYTCSSCGMARLFPVSGNSGCLASLVQLLFRRDLRPRCPRCSAGVLSSEMFARS
jgi:hypothetical protein